MNLENFIAVTNRKICEANNINLLNQIEMLCRTEIKAIILREKDLDMESYEKLAKSAIDVCSRYNKKLILHSFVDVAVKLQHPFIHLPMHLLTSDIDYVNNPNINCTSANDSSHQDFHFTDIGCSVHSAREAIKAEKLGASYIIAGNIYETTCKPGLEGRGLDFLSEVCNAVNIPVYAIGGINFDNITEVMSQGAAGGCIMSTAMVPSRLSSR